jgi:hypothetical protein
MKIAVIAGLLLTACATVPKVPQDPPCYTRLKEIKNYYGDREPDYTMTSGGVRTIYFQTVSAGVTTRNHYTLRHVEYSSGPICDVRSSREVLRSQN